MLTSPNEPVDKALVHKRDERNILIADLRLELPPVLSRAALEEVAGRDTGAAAVLRRFYAPGRLSGLEGWGDPDGTSLVLTSLMPILRARPAELEAALAGLDDDARAELAALYQPRGDELVLAPGIEESAADRLLEAFGITDAAPSAEDRLRISHALDRLDEPPRAYRADLLVDTSHEFFFEHPNEHVPALLMIEAVRQFVMATEHKFRRLPVDSQIILTTFSSRVQSYVDLCMPVTLHCRELGREAPRAGRVVNNVRLTVSVRQGGKVAATFELSGDGISHALFERARRNRAPMLAGRIFALRPHVAHEATLEVGSSQRVAGRLTTVWLEGFRVQIAAGVELPGGECTFALTFPELETVRGRGRIVGSWPENGAACAEIEIVELGKAEQQAYHKAISQNCSWTGSGRLPVRAPEPVRVGARRPEAPAGPSARRLG